LHKISRWKNMDQINDCGRRAAAKYPDMIYWDYNWRKGVGSARMIEIRKRENFYQQEYYGCVYSLVIQTVIAWLPEMCLWDSYTRIPNRFFKNLMFINISFSIPN
jgi:predicted adenine nucleotide alpha hydrolase (AANH) superfamily ATPase